MQIVNPACNSWQTAAAGPGTGTARGRGSLLAGGEGSVIDPAGPAESDSDSDRESYSQGSDPENRDQTDVSN